MFVAGDRIAASRSPASLTNDGATMRWCAFGFVPLSPTEMIAIATTYLGATEATEPWSFRASGPTPA
jgi:hypothetical protein